MARGSLYYEKSRSRWRATYYLPDGEKRSVMGATQEEARVRRDEKVAALESGRPTSLLGANPTVAEVAGWWLESIAPLKVRPSTLRSYAQDIARICAEIGTLPMTELDRSKAQEAVVSLRARYGHGTVKNARARLRQVAEAAVELHYLTRNPVAKVAIPPRTESERARRRTLNAAEVRQLLSVLDGSHPMDAAVAILFTVGLRASEVVGLAWSDLDLDANTATIVRGCTYTPETGCRLDEPKTRRTVGTVRLMPVVVALLRSRRTQQDADRQAAGRAWETVKYEGVELEMVFTTALGRLTHEQALGKALAASMTRAGLEPSTATHMGRRSVITNLTDAGVQLHEVSDYVGHASIETTQGYLQHRTERSIAVAGVAADLFETG